MAITAKTSKKAAPIKETDDLKGYSGGAGAGTAPAVETPKETENAGIDTSVPSLYELTTTANFASQLDQAGKTYLSELVDYLKKKPGVDVRTVNSSHVEARYVVDRNTKSLVLLLFADTYVGPSNMAPSILSASIIDTIHADDKETLSYDALQTITVTREDYALSNNMGAFILNLFESFGGRASQMTVQSLRGHKIHVITNIEEVRQFVRSVSPHAVPARDDIGFLFCIDRRNNNPFNIQTPDLDKVFAVTGYTRFLSPEAAGCDKFLPVVTITDIVSKVANTSLLGLILPIAVDMFIRGNLWTTPYRTFAKGRPNLGNLMLDPATKTPKFTESELDLNVVLNSWMVQPYFAIDIADGRARMPGIDALTSETGIVDVYETIQRFYGFSQPPNEPALTDKNLSVFKLINYTGTYIDSGTTKDTRCVDYLNVIDKIKDYNKVKHLLQQPYDRDKQLEYIREFCPENTRTLYEVATVVLTSQAIVDLSMLMNAGLNNVQAYITYDTAPQGFMNMSPIAISRDNDFSALASFAGPAFRNNAMSNSLPYANLFRRR